MTPETGPPLLAERLGTSIAQRSLGHEPQRQSVLAYVGYWHTAAQRSLGHEPQRQNVCDPAMADYGLYSARSTKSGA